MKPVAWINKNNLVTYNQSEEFNIPLYTSPQFKNMTDEEILEVWNAFERTDNLPILDFARAILRKAQGKI